MEIYIYIHTIKYYHPVEKCLQNFLKILYFSPELVGEKLLKSAEPIMYLEGQRIFKGLVNDKSCL